MVPEKETSYNFRSESSPELYAVLISRLPTLFLLHIVGHTNFDQADMGDVQAHRRGTAVFT